MEHFDAVVSHYAQMLSYLRRAQEPGCFIPHMQNGKSDVPHPVYILFPGPPESIAPHLSKLYKRLTFKRLQIRSGRFPQALVDTGDPQ
jgi:hypothetical protein